MHTIQKQIIQSLLFTPTLKYSELKGQELSSDKFWFHLKQLIKEGYIEKHDESYVLTELGKLQAHDFDNLTLKDLVKPLTVVAVAIKYQDKYLLTQRTKQPFYGYFGFPGGKVEFSEALSSAGMRVLKSETGIEVKSLSLVGIQHEMNINTKGEIIRDIYLYVLKGEVAKLPTNILDREGTPNILSKLECLQKEPRFKDVDSFFEHENTNNLFFEEFTTNQSL